MVLDDATAVRLFVDFRSRYSLVSDPSEPASYPDFSGGTFDIGGMAFSMMAREHVTTIANTVNALLMYLRQLKAWNLVLADLDDETAWHALIDFVQPTAYFCLDSPYRIKQRICTSTAQLSHQANRGRVEGWTDRIVLGQPKFDDAKRHAKHWDDWPALEGCLAQLDSPAFRESVDDFRNEFHHGFPRRVGTGHTAFVERTVTETGVSYGFGSKPPLTLGEVVEALEIQYSAAHACYEAYARLVCTQRGTLLLHE